MHLIGEQGVGIFLLVVLALQGGAMLVCTRRFLQIKPEGQGIVMAENYFNTAILILFIPLIAVSLIIGWYEILDLTHLAIAIPWLIYGLEAIGIALIICGTAMVVLGFLTLGDGGHILICELRIYLRRRKNLSRKNNSQNKM